MKDSGAASPRQGAWRALLRASVPAILAAGSPADAQRPSPKPEVRADVLSGATSAVQLGAAWNLYLGPYLRTSFIGAAGPARHRGEVRGSGRVEALARFHLDPQREFRVGLFGSGGIGLLYDPFSRWRPRLVALVGAEFPTRGNRAWSMEAGLGGGLRVGAALRWTGAARP